MKRGAKGTWLPSCHAPTVDTQFLWASLSPGEGNGNPLQYSCLENPMDRGAWQATVHGFARVRHDLVTKPPPFFTLSTNFLFRDWTSNLSVKKKTPVLKQHANLIGENLCPNSMIRKKHLSLTEGFSGRTDHGQLGRRQILCFQCN